MVLLVTCSVDPKSYFRKLYFGALDIIISELNVRLNQHRGSPIVAKLEEVLIKAAYYGMPVLTEHLPEELDMYNKDLDKQHLLVQMQILPDLLLCMYNYTYNESNFHIAIKSVTNLQTLCNIMNDVTLLGVCLDK